MKLDEYQEKAHETAGFHNTVARDYCVLGLASEAGEVAGVRKKLLRGDYDHFTYEDKLIKELGDVLWYLAETASVHGLSLEHIAKVNLTKLLHRKKQGTIKGEGDNR